MARFIDLFMDTNNAQQTSGFANLLTRWRQWSEKRSKLPSIALAYSGWLPWSSLTSIVVSMGPRLTKSQRDARNRQHISGWWFEPLWKIWKSVGMMRFPIYGKIQNGNQNTNQILWCGAKFLEFSLHPAVLSSASFAHEFLDFTPRKPAYFEWASSVYWWTVKRLVDSASQTWIANSPRWCFFMGKSSLTKKVNRNFPACHAWWPEKNRVK